MPAPRKIALFGGTFDPVHQGHLEIAAKAVNTLDLNTLIFIPCRQSPHKDRSPAAPDTDRLQMLQLATADLPWALVDDFELHRPPPSYTWETVAHFARLHPEPAQLFLLIGEDQWQDLPHWKNPRFLCENVTFIVVGRDHQPTPRPRYQAHFITGNHPASSSQIRAAITTRRPPLWLPPSVAHHIAKKGLYSPTT